MTEGFLMKQNFFLTKYSPRNLIAAFLTSAIILPSFIIANPVSAESVSNVLVQARANGQVLLNQQTTASDGCNVIVDGNNQFITGPKVVCALVAVASSYTLTNDPSYGVFLESINGVTSGPGWVYTVNNNRISSGIAAYSLQNGDSVLFKFSNDSAGTIALPQAPVILPQPPVVSNPPAVVSQSSAPTNTTSSNPSTPTTSVNNNCSIRVSWTAFQNQRPIFYGSWDGTYTIFVFPDGQTRDQFVWSKKITATTVDVTGLQNGKSYRGEIFITGAFLSGATPYWSSFGPVGCKVANTTSTSKPQTKTNTTTTEVTKTTRAKTTENKDQVIEKALSYLITQQDSSGEIESLGISGWVLLAFSASGKSNEKLVSFLKENSNFDKVSDVERTILVAVASGIDPKNFNNTNLIKKLRGFEVNGQIGDEQSLSDDIFGILAFTAAGEKDDPLLNKATSFVIKNQNQDGGWGFQVGQQSDVDTTAAAIEALKAAKKAGLSVTDSIFTNAKNYLYSAQNSDGGFGFNTGDQKASNTSSTAWAIQALISLGETPTKALTFLRNQQLSNGSFKVDSSGQASNLATAYAIAALAEKPLPIVPSVLGASTEVIPNLPDTGFDQVWLGIISIVLVSFGLLLITSRRFQAQNRRRVTFNFADFADSIHHRRRVRLRD